MHLGDERPFRGGHRSDGGKVRTLTTAQDLVKNVRDACLHGTRGQVQNAHVLDISALDARVPRAAGRIRFFMGRPLVSGSRRTRHSRDR